MKYPYDVQQEVFSRLIEQAMRTTWGIQYAYDSISSIKEYQEHAAITTAIVVYGIANLDHLLSREGYYLPDDK